MLDLDLDPQLTAVLAIAACAVGLLVLPLLVTVAVRLRRLRRRVDRAFGGARGEDVLGALGRHEVTIDQLADRVRQVDTRTDELRDVVGGAVSQVGMVRYDAFDDMGGALSFSAALLDERGDGIVLSAINGRSETRCYAKPVQRGVSEHSLSHEGEAAVGTAVSGGGMGQASPAAIGRRRRRSS